MPKHWQRLGVLRNFGNQKILKTPYNNYTYVIRTTSGATFVLGLRPKSDRNLPEARGKNCSPISLQESLSPFNSRLATTLKTGSYISLNSIDSYG
ncbi:hypothetical protein L3X38_036005 [Prunus dulcis]|uniref:Uncharacterized protein n=1 Tax=Prunus dulcis TaxID=3755 RepID=A0AAD4YPX8_PRUDU|nr:hypothetical protein L3X38_036005 [Prunus dulcis]